MSECLLYEQSDSIVTLTLKSMKLAMRFQRMKWCLRSFQLASESMPINR